MVAPRSANTPADRSKPPINKRTKRKGESQIMTDAGAAICGIGVNSFYLLFPYAPCFIALPLYPFVNLTQPIPPAAADFMRREFVFDNPPD